MPAEEAPVRTGAVYTPQFIAGFFARFIRENTTPKRFRLMRTIDPACGSGIFLRTLLELQCDPLVPGTTKATIETAFRNAEGIDKDPNACEATRLSLALLHLIASDSLPRAVDLRVFNRDAISAALSNEIDRGHFGAVLANPPYIKLEHLGEADRATYRAYLVGKETGRFDAYVAMAHLCLELCEPGGFVCLVLAKHI
jgi:type I restriction-modification system DNA methylase subunit